jgi:anaerobic magnesium-protoporphyrin IX monomethyl ester cyclase
MTTLLTRSGQSLVILAYPRVEHEKDYLYHWMPFSLLTIAGALPDDVDVVIFDGNERTLEQWSAFLDENIERSLCIGISIMTGGQQIRHGLDMAREAKRRSECPPIVWGGPHVNVLPEQTAKHELVDVVLRGPGQTSMSAYLASLRGQLSLDQVPGLLIREGGKEVRGPVNPPQVTQLGGYPWHLLDVHEYIRDDPTIAPRTLNYVSSQGCVYRCKFCYETSYQRKWSAMPAGTLADDVQALTETYNLSGIKLYDADAFVQPKRMIDFCGQLIERDLHIAWAASINPNDVLRSRRQGLDLLRAIASTQCRRLLMGIESGSDRVLRQIVKKDITRADALDVATAIAEAGILGCYTFIVGFPGETEDEVDETYSLLEQLQQLDPMPETRVHLFGPFPGTPLWESAVAAGFEAPTDLEGWAGFDYYDSQTPWTSAATVARARAHTRLVKRPSLAAAGG